MCTLRCLQCSCGHTTKRRITKCDDSPWCVSEIEHSILERDCDDCVRAVKTLMASLRHLQSRSDDASKKASSVFQDFWRLRDSQMTWELDEPAGQETCRKTDPIEGLQTLDKMDDVDNDKIYSLYLDLGKLLRNGHDRVHAQSEKDKQLMELINILTNKCQRFRELEKLWETFIFEKRNCLVEQLEGVPNYPWHRTLKGNSLQSKHRRKRTLTL